jgi:hypothetical protein
MHAGDNDDLIVKDAIEKSVRETAEKRAACLTMDDGKLQRVGDYGLHEIIRRREKFLTETCLLSLVSAVGTFNVWTRRDEQSATSPGTAANLPENLLPGNALRS